MVDISRVLFLSFCLLLGSAALAQKPPNIVFIMTDDHAAHAISSYGSKLIKTPHLDQLAKEGMRFENAFVTNSICTPSRAVILTGKYSHLNGVPVFNHIDNSQPLVSKYLQAAGYYTGMVGKWHLGANDPNRPDDGKPTGFDYWNILPGQGAYFDPVMIEMGQRKKLMATRPTSLPTFRLTSSSSARLTSRFF